MHRLAEKLALIGGRGAYHEEWRKMVPITPLYPISHLLSL